MKNEAANADNFEATKNKPPRRYQVLTLFKIPMSDDRKIGEKISADEYLEIFCTGLRSVVVQIRRDHQSY